MERKRKNFGYLTTKVYLGNKTVGIHFDKNDKVQGFKLAQAILAALEHGKGIDITIFKYKPLKSGKIRVTITAPK